MLRALWIGAPDLDAVEAGYARRMTQQDPPAPLSPHPDRLRDRAAIVTGGASGIGRASALRLAAEGARVAIGDLDEAGAKSVAAEIEAAGGRAIAIQTDVSDEDAIVRLVAQTVESFGKLDILHNNAAALGNARVGVDFSIAELDVDVWDRTMEVNVRSVMLGCKHAIPPMLAAGGGSIINTYSGAALAGSLTGPAYASSKAAVNTLTLYMAAQYGKQGIRCNAILPGLIMTPAVAVGMGEAEVAMLLDHHLTPQAGHPDDIAGMVAYLASDEARYITAQLIRVDGGITTHAPSFADNRRAMGVDA
jgi:NAD(P)-dependent dehydrogenase (short-subunit alcohol dehydrogenase family)